MKDAFILLKWFALHCHGQRKNTPGAALPDSLAMSQVLISLGSCVEAGKVKKSVRNENKMRILTMFAMGFLLRQCAAHTPPRVNVETSLFFSHD